MNANHGEQKQRAKRRPAELAQPVSPAPIGKPDLASLQRTVKDPSRARPADILALQRAAGNRVVSRLIQAKLTVGPPGDQYEQEADRVAEQVLSMPTPTYGEGSRGGRETSLQRQDEEEEVQMKPDLQRQEEEEEIQTKPLVQRQEDEEEVQTKPLLQRQEEEEELQMKPDLQRQEEEEELQMKPDLQRQEEEEEVQTKPLLQRQGGGGLDAGPEFEGRLTASLGTGTPLPGDVRAFMEPRFGADFSGVHVHTGSDAADLSRSLSAQAFTHGQDIYVGSGKYDPGTTAGKQLLAHELTHVVQQTGHVAPSVQRWGLSTPLKGQAGHETLTLEALKKAYPMVFLQAQNYKDAEGAWEYIRGALWNDDPSASLFWTRHTRGLGLSFVARFLKGEHSDSSRGPSGSLTGRSHVGDLQFLHGMADPTETTIDTKNKMMRWAEFTYKIAIGVIAPQTLLGQVPVPGIPQLFPKQADWTINQLFDVSNTKSAAAQRATGSLLHMMQDTFCESHTGRTRDAQNQMLKGKITGFRAYGAQDTGKHAVEDDLVRAGVFRNRTLKKAGRNPQQMAGILGATPGAQQAVDIGAKILTFIGGRKPWDSAFQEGDQAYAQGVKGYLDTEVFGLEQGVEQNTAAPGAQFRKPMKDIRKDFKSNTSLGWFKGRAPQLKSIDELLVSYEHLEKANVDAATRKGVLKALVDRTRSLLMPGAAGKLPFNQEITRELTILTSILEEMQRDTEKELAG